jgi:hypothetical protein
MDKVVQNHSCASISYGSSKTNFVVIAFSCGGEIGIESTARSPARITVFCGLSGIEKTYGTREHRWVTREIVHARVNCPAF